VNFHVARAIAVELTDSECNDEERLRGLCVHVKFSISVIYMWICRNCPSFVYWRNYYFGKGKSNEWYSYR